MVAERAGASLMPGAQAATWAGALLVVALMVGVPLVSHVQRSYGAHDAGRIAQGVVLLLCAAAWLLNAAARPATGARAGQPLRGLGLAVVVLALSSAGLAPDGVHAARELALLAGLVAATVCLGSLDAETELPRLLACVAVGSAMYALVVFGIAVAVLVGGAPLITNVAFFGYDNFRFYNHVQTVALPLLALAAGTPTVGRWVRAVAFGGLVLGCALLLLAAGRATGLGLLVACGVTLALFRARALRLVGVLVAGVALGGLAFGALTQLLPRWSGVPTVVTLDRVVSTGNDHARVYLWQLAAGYIEEAPWLGIGPMHYAHRLNIKAAHPHNIYLQVAAEFGVPMLLLAGGLAAWALWRLGRRIGACLEPAQRVTGIGLFTACVAVAVDAAFSGNFVMPISQMWIVFLLAFSVAWCRSQAARTDRTTAAARPVGGTRWRRLLLPAAVLASQGWLVFSVYPEASHLAAHMEQAQQQLKNARTDPRFWSYGWF